MRALRLNLAALVIPLAYLGCVRAGFEALESATGAPDSRGASTDRGEIHDVMGDAAGLRDDGGDQGERAEASVGTDAGPHVLIPVTRANDTCSQAARVDLAAGHPYRLLIDTTGATDEHGHCGGTPEVVLRFENGSGNVTFSCAGHPGVVNFVRYVLASCPPSGPSINSGTDCQGQGSMNRPVQAGDFLHICAAPADGPVSFLLEY